MKEKVQEESKWRVGKENIEIFKENKKIFGTYIKKEKKERKRELKTTDNETIKWRKLRKKKI